jgi:hypothetical protein
MISAFEGPSRNFKAAFSSEFDKKNPKIDFKVML